MENDNLEAKKCDTFLYWSIVIFSSQNILFYLYWSRLWDYLNSLVKNMGII